MYCSGCKSNLAARTLTWYEEGVRLEHCDICGNQPAVWLPDVFLGSSGGGREQTDENLCNDKGVPIPFSTKREKAAVMNHLGVKQHDSAERQGGYRNETKRKTYFV